VVFAQEVVDTGHLWHDGCEDPDLAYLLFTSGSTGSPKGVPISTASLSAYLDNVTSFYGYSYDDRHSQTFDLSFDLAMHDLLVTAYTGGALVPFLDADLLSAGLHAETHGVTCWFSVPSQAALMHKARTLAAGTMHSLRLSLFCGEPFSWDLAKRWQAAAPNSVIENLYGPTEATIAMSRFRFHPAQADEEPKRGLVPIGSPFPGMEVRLDKGLAENSDNPGTTGELLISGSQLSNGYWRSRTQTENSFIRFGDEPETVWYRTGDIVEQPSSGILHFVGRTDQQIKIGGHRIEIGEVESELRNVSGAPASAVVPWPLNTPDIKSLVGFVEGSSIDDSQIRKLLRERLPDYMVPKRVYAFDELPRNTSGKIDRRRLAEHLGGTDAGLLRSSS
jgi:acyl-coenzyme A synthetase/AMP-(fatty) acid ligase